MTVSYVPSIEVSILGLQGIMGYTLSGPYDVLTSIGSCWEGATGQSVNTTFNVDIVSEKPGRVQTFNQLKIESTRLYKDVEKTDLIIIPSLNPDKNGQCHLSEGLVKWLNDQHSQGSVLASICAGSFALAEAGLLDGRLATTHWAYRDLFRKTYPNVYLQPDEMLTDDNRLICAGGSASWQYLTSYLLVRFGDEELASHANRFFLLSGGLDKQTPCIPLAATLAENDLIIREVQLWLNDHMSESDLLVRSVEYSGLTERTFKRRFKNATGQTPLEYIQNIRIEKAKRLLEKPSNTLPDILEQIGYSEDSSFRRLFKRKVGITTYEYRRGFSMPVNRHSDASSASTGTKERQRAAG